ncbi:SLC13 family permease [Chloroflexota bacterium]
MIHKRWIGPLLGIIILTIFLVLPPAEPLTAIGMKAIGVLLFTVVWWVTVGVGYPSLICIGLLAITGVRSPEALFALSWGNYLVIFIISVFGLSECLRITGFSNRFALWFLTRPFTEGHPWIMISMLLLATCLLGSIMSGSATCITFMAIATPMLAALGYKKGDRFAATLMMGIAWSGTVAFIMTPIGHGSNLMVIEWIRQDTGFNMTFPLWMAVGVPAGLLFWLLILGYLRFVIRPDVSRFRGAAVEFVREEQSKMGPITAEEKLTIVIFLAVLVVWITPGFFGDLLPGISKYFRDNMGYAVPPLIGACLMCIIRIKDKPLLNFQQWMKGVPWPTVALIAAIMIVRDILASPDTGIPQMLVNIFEPIVNNVPFFVYRVIGQFWVSIQTNLMSNSVSGALVYKALVPALISSGIGNAVAMGFTIFAGARSGFALPSANSTCALISGSGWVPIGFLFRHGAVLTIGIILICIFIVYPLAAFIYV